MTGNHVCAAVAGIVLVAATAALGFFVGAHVTLGGPHKVVAECRACH